MQEEKSTANIIQELTSVKTLSEGSKVIANNQKSIVDMSLRDFFDTYLLKHPELKRPRVINDSNISRQHAYAILNCDKNGNRDKIIALCFAAKMSVEETNHALIYAGHAPLHAKNNRDAEIIVAITTRGKGSRECDTVTDLSLWLDEKGLGELNLGGKY